MSKMTNKQEGLIRRLMLERDIPAAVGLEVEREFARFGQMAERPSAKWASDFIAELMRYPAKEQEAAAPTDKQIAFIERLLKRKTAADLPESDRGLVEKFYRGGLTRAEASRLIDGLKGGR